MDAYATLERAYAALGRAAVPVIGTSEAKTAAREADRRDLPDAEVFALAAEVQALAALIGSGRG